MSLVLASYGASRATRRTSIRRHLAQDQGGDIPRAVSFARKAKGGLSEDQGSRGET